MNRVSALVCPVAFCLLVLPLSAQVVDPGAVEAIGTASTAGKPQLADWDKATVVALRSALDTTLDRTQVDISVNRVARVLVGAMDLKSLGDFASVQRVESRRTGFDGSIEIRLIAQINADKLNQWLARINHFPIKEKRIMIVLPEQNLRGPIPDPAGETEMLQVFTTEGFKTIDQKQVATIRNNDLVKAAVAGDPKELVAIAQNMGADLILVGEAFSQDTQRDARDPKFPARARIEARIIRCDTGEVVAAGDATGGAEDLSQAVADKAAIRAAADKLANQMVLDLLIEKHPPSVRIVLTGADFESKLKFKQLLGTLTDTVTKVSDVSFADGRAEMDVLTTACAGDLADAVFIAAKKDGLNLKVVEQTDQRCTFDVSSAQSAPGGVKK